MRTVDLAAVAYSNKQRIAYLYRTRSNWTPDGNLAKAISEEDWKNYKIASRQLPDQKKLNPLPRPIALRDHQESEPVVYEIMFQYINPEVSLAYVQPMFLSDVPPHRKYFITSALAQHEVDKINSNPLCQ